MPRVLILGTMLLAALPAGAETRCGWYHNPTPANVILEDADGQWWISKQGEPPASGFDTAYDQAFDDRLRIDYAGQATDRYGYSCACAEGAFNPSGGQYDNVVHISRLYEIPLARCQADPALPKP